MLITLSDDSHGDPERVVLFDTTLRAGVQARGRSMPRANKVRIAGLLAELGVDVIEAGYPGASRVECDSVYAIASEVQSATICAVASCEPDDIELADKALRKAGRRRIRVCSSNSTVTSQHIPSRENNLLLRTIGGVRIARSLCDDVEFSAHDTSRIEPRFLAEVVEAAVDFGASTVNISDSVGNRLPDEVSELFRYLRKNVHSIDRARLSVHCHDALGLAMANSLAAVVAGARQVECSVSNGEQLGNCGLEALVTALIARESFFNVKTAIHSERLSQIPRAIAEIKGTRIDCSTAPTADTALNH